MKIKIVCFALALVVNPIILFASDVDVAERYSPLFEKMLGISEITIGECRTWRTGSATDEVRPAKCIRVGLESSEQLEVVHTLFGGNRITLDRSVVEFVPSSSAPESR